MDLSSTLRPESASNRSDPMGHSAFDNLFSSTLHPEAAYYTNVAMDYLNEIEEMKDKFGECSDTVQTMKEKVFVLRQGVDKYKSQIVQLKDAALEKEREIALLRAQLKNRGLDMSSPVDLGKIELQVKALEKQIQFETQRYNQTGRYQNIEMSINNVRNVFSFVLHELNKANAQNVSVESILRTLLTLEVKFLFLNSIKF